MGAVMHNLHIVFLVWLITTGAFAQTGNATATTTQLETQRTCSLAKSWNDKGSGADLDGFFYIPVAQAPYFIIGGYGTRQKKLTAEDCVLAVGDSERLVAPIAWELIWLDRGTGARLDGSMWRAIPPGNDYRCIGSVPQIDYEKPSLSNYRCVLAEFTEKVVTGSLIWTDRGSGAKKPVSMFKLPHSGSFVAVQGRLAQIEAYDLKLTPPAATTEEAEQAAPEVVRQETGSIVRELEIEMVSIPAGAFRMGDMTGEGFDSEAPVHDVMIAAFKLGKYEVTFAQWDACVAAGGCGGYVPDDAGWGRGNRPVMNVSWDDAHGFIKWLNAEAGADYRLPTEAEWEYAARAGSSSRYNRGDDIGHNQANCYGCGSRWDGDRTAPVGSFSASAWGLHDMHGNVWEWVQDCWHDNYTGAPGDGSAWTVGSDCGLRVVRSGSWGIIPRYLRSAARGGDTHSTRYDAQGFRLAQDQ